MSSIVFRSLARRGNSAYRGLPQSRRSLDYTRRNMGGGTGNPHVPEGYDKLGTFCLVSAFFWIMYRGKENRGQLFGLYLPWLDEHEHHHVHYAEDGDGGDTMPTLEEEED